MIHVKFNVYVKEDWDMHPEIKAYFKGVDSIDITDTLFHKAKEVFDNSKLKDYPLSELMFRMSACTSITLDDDYDSIGSNSFSIDSENDNIPSDTVILTICKKMSFDIYQYIEETIDAYKELESSGMIDTEEISNGIYKESTMYYWKDGEKFYV